MASLLQRVKGVSVLGSPKKVPNSQSSFFHLDLTWPLQGSACCGLWCAATAKAALSSRTCVHESPEGISSFPTRVLIFVVSIHKIGRQVISQKLNLATNLFSLAGSRSTNSEVWPCQVGG